jgi:hypothetical protein
MAPTTRLREQPDRRVEYGETARSNQAQTGDWNDPIVIADRSPTPPTTPRSQRFPRTSLTRAPFPKAGKRPLPDVLNRQTKQDGSIVKTPTPKKRARAEQVWKECMICAHTKTEKRSFTKLETGSCEHLKEICNRCVGGMIKAKISERKLNDAVLACPIPSCKFTLEHSAVQKILSRAQSDRSVPCALSSHQTNRHSWDRALTTHLLRTSDAFMACLSPACGQYFSKESCGLKRANSKHEIQCPYCEYFMCLTCVRPWHPKTSCNKESIADNKKSEAAIKSLGAKPCPECGINIEKNGGCNHINCKPTCCLHS